MRGERMEKRATGVLALALACISVGCSIMVSDSETETSSITFPEQYRDMAFIQGFTAPLDDTTRNLLHASMHNQGVYTWARLDNLDGTVRGFQIAKYETIYELWYVVKTWAEKEAEHPYTFANPGREGLDGTPGAAPAGNKRYQPVTDITWRDAIVWCNAYSEKEGRMQVYIHNGEIIRDATAITMGEEWVCDKAEINFYADGYRLPTELEWETAARGGDYTIQTDWRYTYPGGSTIEYLAWYKDNAFDVGRNGRYYGVNPVGLKTPNRVEVYDMAGNVWEWCWDWYGFYSSNQAYPPATGPEAGENRIIRGGSWFDSEERCIINFRNKLPPGSYGQANPDSAVKVGRVGFRVAANEE
jgi:formylglycine-generating enzyme required for sulfatase activity